MSSMQFDVSMLASSPLFAGLEKEALDGLARYSRHISLESNEQLFKQGDPSDGFYAILEGVLNWKVF